MSSRGEWVEKTPVAFCRARFSYTGMEKGDLTFSRDEVLLACPLSLASVVHRTAPRERGASTAGDAATQTTTSSTTSGLRWVLGIHPYGDCGRIPANYVVPLPEEETSKLMEQRAMVQLMNLFKDLQEAAEEQMRKPPPAKKRSGSRREKRKSKVLTPRGKESTGEVPTRTRQASTAEAATTTTTTTTVPPPPPPVEVKSSDSQLQRLIQQKLKKFEDDPSGTLKFYQNMRQGVQSLFEPPSEEDEAMGV